MSTPQHTARINDLPNEVLEYLLSLLSPYRDYKNVMLVCRRWYHLMKGVKEREFQSFHEAVSDGGLWWTAHPSGPNPNITERYSHSACYLNKCLYIFGGCTSNNTAFNDLWKLDLGTGEWIRPLAMGTYPSPKAYASLVPHRGRLVLFGGWSHPTPLSLHQAARFFLQLHTYTPESNNWEEIVTISSPQGLAGHGATVIGDTMVVFGGCTVNGVSCNDVWMLDLVDYEWTLKIPAGSKPQPRYGHAQVKIDDNHILVVGGCGGPNMQFTDTWMLSMDDEGWRWEEIKVAHPENSAPQIWCHPACKVGDKMVVLSKISRPSSSPSSPSSVPQFRDPPISVIGETYRSASVNRCEGKMSTAQGHCVCCQEVALVDKMSLRAKRSHPETSESSSQESSSDTDDGGSQCLASARAGRGYRSGGLGGRKSVSVTGEMAPPSSDRMPSSRYVFGSRAAAQSVSLPCQQMEPQQPKNASAEQASNSRERLKASSPQPSGHAVSTSPPGGRNGLPLIRPNAMRNRQKQLEMLKRYEDRIKGQRARDGNPVYISNCCHGSSGPCKPLFPTQKLVTHPMYIYCLDLSGVTATKTVSWLPLTKYGIENAPEETLFYSLVQGRGELIMFGGIQTDVNNMRRPMQSSNVVSNAVYFLSCKKILR